jgi:transposase
VWIPGIEDEDCREILRYRYEQVWGISKQKQKINSMIKRHGCEYTLTKSKWTKPHYKWLRGVELPSGTRLVLDLLLRELDSLEAKLVELDKELDNRFAENPRYDRLKTYYEFFKGVGRVGSMTLVLEGHDLRRFPRPSSLMNYTGLIPKKESSGDKDPALHITKAGNKYLRLALVGAAKHYRDRRKLYNKSGLDRLPDEIRELIERCQNRLHSRYRYLCAEGKHSNKAKVAIARELCGFIWEMAVKLNVADRNDVLLMKKAA